MPPPFFEMGGRRPPLKSLSRLSLVHYDCYAAPTMHFEACAVVSCDDENTIKISIMGDFTFYLVCPALNHHTHVSHSVGVSAVDRDESEKCKSRIVTKLQLGIPSGVSFRALLHGYVIAMLTTH